MIYCLLLSECGALQEGLYDFLPIGRSAVIGQLLNLRRIDLREIILVDIPIESANRRMKHQVGESEGVNQGHHVLSKDSALFE